jgi:hypothetical protein
LKITPADDRLSIKELVMSQESEGRRYRMIVGLLVCSACFAGPAIAEPDTDSTSGLRLFEVSRDILRADRPLRAREFGAVVSEAAGTRTGRAGRPQLDVSPVIEEIFGFLHRHGVPLQEQRDENGRGPIGVYGDFRVGNGMPAVSFNLGDRPIEPLGAFYTNDRGFRCAVVWPVSRFTLRLEAGEDSEFGYYGIAGVQWLHPHRPLAIGIGVPMNLRNAEGGVGFIVQLRMILD